MEGPWTDSEEKREPVSDIDTEAADSLKALDPKRPIREERTSLHFAFGLESYLIESILMMLP